MDIHYNAFISYRHHPDDIRVASQIHRLLEHYRVPRAIRKRGGSITRLFRDKEELPITSNLTDDITRALVNSDYLIVICSTHTRESTWVRREIETFLKTHDRNKVLTVLVDGEPYDTIPEILLHEEVVDPVTGEVTVVDIEPLSCDWRMPQRQARREELPRLAAALLGCGYDELRRRERQYRTRRLVAGFSVALAATLCFAAYVMHNSMQIQQANDRLEEANTQLENANTSLENANVEIQANLNEALINQSQYLASSAEKLLEEGDRMTAMLLALEALPEYEGERPYAADAEYALASAVGAYEAEKSAVAAGSFTCDDLISDFRVTEDGNTIYIRDARNVLTVWDTQTFEKLASVSLNHAADEMMVTQGGNLLILDTGDILACYDRAGQQVWSMSCKVMDVAFLGDRGTLLAGESINRDGAEDYDIHILDAETGSADREPLRLATEDILYFLREEYAAGGKLILKSLNYPVYSLHMLDPETGALEQVGDGVESVYTGGMTNNGDLLALVWKEELSGLQGNYLGFTLTAPELLYLQCYSGTTGKLLWETEMTTYLYSSYSTVEVIPESDDILCQTGNLFLTVDSATGEIKAKSEATTYVMWTKVGANSTRALLMDGSIGSFNYADSYCGFIPCTKDNLVCVDVQNDYDYYVVDELSSQVTVYRYIGDDNFTSIGTGCYLYPYEWHTYGAYTALEGYDKLQMLNASEGELLWELETYGAEIIGFSEDGATLWAAGNYTKVLLEIDVETGDVTEWTLPREVEGISPFTGELGMLTTTPISREILVSGSCAYYLAEYYSTSETYLFRYDFAAGMYDCWSLYEWDETLTSYGKYGRLVGVSGDYALVWNQTNNTLLEFSAKSEESRVLAENIVTLPAFLLAENGKYWVGTADAVQLRTWGGEAEQEIPLAECRAVSLCQHNGEMLVLGDDGSLYRFDMSGNLLSKSGLSRYNTFSTTITGSNFDHSGILWDFTNDGDLLLGVCSAGNLVDTETWKSRAWIPYYYGYIADQNRVLVNDPETSNSLGTFPLYSTGDIMTMAKEALNGSELTEDQRAAYGLD